MFLSTPPSRVATIRTSSAALTTAGFYPRHPRGWRRDIFFRILMFWLFLSTPPSRVATRISAYRRGNKKSFYPRHPRGWRQSPA